MIRGRKYITYDQYGGRTGHALKDILTCYTLASIMDNIVVLPRKSWNTLDSRLADRGIITGQNIINFDTDKSQPMLDKGDFSKIITIQTDREHSQWNGMSFDFFSKLKKQIEDAPRGSLIVLSGVIRLNPIQLTNWYDEKLIKKDAFAIFISNLRSLYFKDNDYNPIDCLSVHVRRGDVANPRSGAYAYKGMRWPVKYFKQAITSFREKFPNTPINVFSENTFSSDLHVLNKIDNLNLILGDCHSLKKDVNYMINSRFFMPCNSSLSTWISYISRGKIIMPVNREIKHFHKKQIW